MLVGIPTRRAGGNRDCLSGRRLRCCLKPLFRVRVLGLCTGGCAPGRSRLTLPGLSPAPVLFRPRPSIAASLCGGDGAPRGLPSPALGVPLGRRRPRRSRGTGGPGGAATAGRPLPPAPHQRHTRHPYFPSVGWLVGWPPRSLRHSGRQMTLSDERAGYLNRIGMG